MKDVVADHLLVFTRYPEPGKAKTRLIPALGAQGAAILHCQMAEHTLAQVKVLQRQRSLSVEIYFAGSQPPQAMQAWLGSDWLYSPQGEGDLGTKLTHAVARAFDRGAKHVIAIGTDCPGLEAEGMAMALDKLQTVDLVLGPATDGGYYLIGMRSLMPALFTNIDWGTATVLQQTVEIATRLNLSVAYLNPLTDVDRPADLPVWEQCQAIAARSSASTLSPWNEQISVIIPVLNEAKTIQSVLTSLYTASSGIEVIVVDGGSSDNTVELAQAMGVKVLSASAGRASQMNVGAAAAIGDILLFLHADTRLPAGFATMVQTTLCSFQAGQEPIAGAFALRIDASLKSLRVIEWGVYWRSRLLQLPYGDQAIFLRKEVFQRLGGFPELPIMEDFEFVSRLRSLGAIAILPTPVITSARRWLRQGVVQTTLINQAIIIAYRLGISTERLARWYRRGKF